MPPATEQQREQVKLALIDAFKAQFGDEAWAANLHRNLKPSPLKQIAETVGVPLSLVRQIRSQFLMAGIMMSHITVDPPATD